MGKLHIYILLLCLLSISVLALDCQYTEQEPYEEFINVFYENGTKLDYDVLEIRDIKGGLFGRTPTEFKSLLEFKVYNNYHSEIGVTVHYLVEGRSTYKVTTIGSREVFHSSQKDGGLPEDIRFVINSPDGLESRWEKRIKQKKVCKKCCNTDTICLNDGQPADSDCKCGSGIRNVNGMCIPSDGEIFNKSDSICHTNYNENCENSPIDCACEGNNKCTNGQCISDCSNPPAGKDCCKGEFRSIGLKDKELPCDCNFECKENLVCSNNKCIEDCSNPPEGIECCDAVFKKIDSKDLGEACGCDFECSVGVCFQNKCEELMTPILTCSSGTSVKKGDKLSCNLVAKNTNLGRDIKVTFVLNAGNGLAFSESMGCQNIKGSQCLGTYTIAELSNEGVEVGLEALAGGDSKVSGEVSYKYKSKVTPEPVPDLDVHIYFCKDGKADEGETKKNCCTDVGVRNFTWLLPWNEVCVDNIVEYEVNWVFIIVFILIIAILFGKILYLKILKEIEKQKTLREERKKEKERQRTLQKEIEHIREKVEYLKNNRLSIKEEIENGEKKIILLKKQIKNSTKKAKEDHEKELYEFEKKLGERKKKLRLNNEELQKKIKEYKKMSKEHYIKKYKDRYGKKIYLDTKKEYLRFKSDNEYLHRYIYRSFYGSFNEKNEIHHIDANHYNNEIWNLIELNHDDHYWKIKHGRINCDWDSGIDELKRIGLSEKDFPEQVIKHLRNR